MIGDQDTVKSSSRTNKTIGIILKSGEGLPAKPGVVM